MTDVELITWLRFWLADITEATISDANMQIILDTVQAQYPSASECETKFRFAVQVLEWLIRNQAKGSSGSSGSGAVKSREEKRGASTIKIAYDTSGTVASSTGWDKVLEDLLAAPNSIGCTVFPSTGSTTQSGSVIIGGKGIPTYGFCSPSRSHLNKFLD